ncbi:MAG: ethylbenzene dehydrogenase-related protein [Planctomycetaceae bacterium]
MRLFAILLLCGLLLPACARDPMAPAPLPLARLEARPLPAGQRIELDGRRNDAAWDETPELVVALTGPGPTEVRLRALHDGERLFLLAEWEDREVSLNRYWKLQEGGAWVRHVGEDGIALLWVPGSLGEVFRTQGCAISCHDARHQRDGPRGYFDVWSWGAQRSSQFGQAIDMVLDFGAGGRLRGDGQPAESGNLPNENSQFRGPAAVPQRVTPESTRFLRWANAQPFSLERHEARKQDSVGWEVPYDLLRPGKGSRGDVAAAGFHAEGRWCVEMSRLFRTGNGDDEPLGDPIAPAHFALTLHDAAEGGDHAISGPIELRFVAAR